MLVEVRYRNKEGYLRSIECLKDFIDDFVSGLKSAGCYCIVVGY